MKNELFLFDEFYKKHFGQIIGVDEAGRGCIAGPVVAAAVVLEKEVEVFDSKQLTPSERERIFEEIKKVAKIGIGLATAEEIDIYNILNATKIAMNRALKALNQPNLFVLVDGKGLNLVQQGVCIVKGDAKSAAVAAASIVAKVVRDRIMKGFDKVYPQYLFAQHKGYPTQDHLKALAEYGATVFHRLTFSPVLPYVNEKILSKISKERALSVVKIMQKKLKIK
ncbi:ribonuclease HII [Pseudothermotoga thermarum]|uniref:Ribonuclease HII n=1 Tax=Pseudothermotoga thermarum DSM 5069 TaxID=688269 RepID=F7YVU7_9THEM|nr:ribonuclease HII [Pseudothermotoga thermarum]AEH51769.1 RNase HII [Pseudothermotoga thermarum DSM 5069]